jgi:hypothetical protein
MIVRHLRWGRCSREARSGELPGEHPEMIVRLSSIIIGKMAGSIFGYFSGRLVNARTALSADEV